MGLFNKIVRKMPGSPTSVAKVMLKVYNGYKTDHPHKSKQDALRYTIENRYSVIRTMDKKEIESCLSESEHLGDLVFLVVGRENPVAVKYPLMKDTVNDLYEFFMREAPDELGGSLPKLKAITAVQI